MDKSKGWYIVEMKIKMFVCGPTVYDYMHLGNARTFVFFDVVAKYLRWRGNDLEYIQNITDSEDKIIARAKEHGREPADWAREWEVKFYEDAKALGITSPVYKKAMDHIPEIISQVKRLIEKGNVYEIKGDGWYFDLSTFPDYGKLSGRTKLQDDDAVSRIDENEHKRNKGDFCVWKGDFKTGRPGWHIEDTAITEKYFGAQYDIHGGGQDLMFPHHEGEIAIMESLSGLKPFVKKWMHAGFLVTEVLNPSVSGLTPKMSKSKGNFITAHEALKHHSPEAIRHYFLSAHYRSPLEYSDDAIAPSEVAVSRLGEFYRKLLLSGETAKSTEAVSPLDAKQDFIAAMDDDFNAPKAMAVLFDLVGKIDPMTIDPEPILEFLNSVNKILGIIPTKQEPIPEEVQRLLADRNLAREMKNFALSDEIRIKIEELGWQVEDTKYGPILKPLPAH